MQEFENLSLPQTSEDSLQDDWCDIKTQQSLAGRGGEGCEAEI